MNTKRMAEERGHTYPTIAEALSARGYHWCIQWEYGSHKALGLRAVLHLRWRIDEFLIGGQSGLWLH
jgi:hypothetical protein